MEDDRSPELTESDMFALLSHRRRRLVVRVVEDFATPLSVCQLTELVGGCEFDDPSSDTLRNVYLSLVHHHVPRLEDDDVIAYDPESGSVEPGRNFGALLGAMRTLSDETDPFVGE